MTSNASTSSNINIYNSTIFSGLVWDVQPKIIYFCDTNSQLQLSQVNKLANNFLSNFPHFHDRFYGQHPCLVPYDKLFTVLISDSNSNCWKILCKVMDPACRVPLPVPFSQSFFEQTKPHVMEKLYSERQGLEEQRKAICGSYIKDPASPIDQAWKQYEEAKQERMRLELELKHKSVNGEPIEDAKEKTMRRLGEAHPDFDDLVGVISAVCSNPEFFIKMTEEEFANLPADKRQDMKIECLEVYREYAQIRDASKEFFKGKSLEDALDGAYKDLDYKQLCFQYHIDQLDTKIASYNENFPQKYQLALNPSFITAFVLENAIINKPHLKKCLELLDLLEKDPQENSPKVLDQIRGLINACTFEYENNIHNHHHPYHRFIQSSIIWESLYDRCGNKVIEDSWAEKHFHKHLPQLSAIINAHLSRARNIIQIHRSESSIQD